MYLCMKVLQRVLMSYDHESLFVCVGIIIFSFFWWDQVRSNVIGSDPQALLFSPCEGSLLGETLSYNIS